jgi:hypothetical protein
MRTSPTQQPKVKTVMPDVRLPFNETAAHWSQELKRLWKKLNEE